MTNCTAYLMAYFGPTEKLYYGWSRDAVNWTTLNDGKPVFDPGSRLRDPYVARAKGTFHLVHTMAWDNPIIYHWESADLIKWMGGPITVVEKEGRRAWAPEFTYVPAEDLFYVYWASLKDNHNTLFYTTTRDWKDITPARSAVFYDIGIHDIDLTIVEHAGTYYGFHKPGDVNDMMNNLLMTTPTLDPARKDFGFGKSDAGIDVLDGASKPTEGPEVIKLIGQDKWYVYCDPFSSPDDLEAWETTDFKTFKKIRVNVPKGAKHCGLVQITEQELQALQAAYK